MGPATISDIIASNHADNQSWRQKLRDRLRLSNRILIESLAEFLGTAVLLIFGYGCVAQLVFSKMNTPLITVPGLHWGWAIGVAMGVWISAGVSGGHLNPAVTLTMAILGRLEWRKVPAYWLAQYLGGFVASFIVYFVYLDALNSFDGGVRHIMDHANATAGIWATYPQPYVTVLGGIMDQTVGTALLVLCVCAVTDSNNYAPSGGLAPLVIGLIVLGIGVSLGFNCGYPINPARDLPARFFTAVAGWGFSVFTARNYWSWIPVVIPHLGALLGAFVYQFFIDLHLPYVISDVTVKPSHDQGVGGDKKGSNVSYLDGIINENFEGDDPQNMPAAAPRKFNKEGGKPEAGLNATKLDLDYLKDPPMESKTTEYSHRL